MGYKLTLPTVGQPSNWGQILNANFKIISDALTQIDQKVNSIRNLVGANVPYIDLQDETKFVIITKQSEELETIYTLEYGKEFTRNGGKYIIENPELISIYRNNSWSNPPPLFRAAYVVDYIDTSGTSEGDSAVHDLPDNINGIRYEQGDLLVRVQQFGSIYSDSASSVNFAKYPTPEDYYIPTISGEPYKMEFVPQNYIQFYEKLTNTTDTSSIILDLPAVGYRAFHKASITFETDGNVRHARIVFNNDNSIFIEDYNGKFSFKFRTTVSEANNLRINTTILHNNSPVFIYYEQTLTIDDGYATIEINIPNLLSLPSGINSLDVFWSIETLSDAEIETLSDAEEVETV